MNSFTNPDKHINQAQIGPSATSLRNENPAFAVIDTDSETMLPLNYQMWAMNLTEANKEGGEPFWEIFVDYRAEYEMEDMSPDSLYKVAERVRDEKKFAGMFEWHKSRKVGDPHPPIIKRGTRHEKFCNLASSETNEEVKCNTGLTESNSWRDLLIGNWTSTSESPLLSANPL